MNNRLRFTGLLWCIVLAGQGQVVGGVTGDVESLTLVAEVHQANLAKIKTWQGVVRDTTYEIELGKTVNTRESLVEFFLDVPGRRLCSLRTFTSTNNGSGGTATVNSVVADGRLSSRNHIGPEPSVVQVQPFTEPMSSAEEAGLFNPMRFLGHHHGFAETFTYLAENAKVPGAVEWVAKREGNLVTLSFTHNDRRDRYVADLEIGGNLVRYEMLSDTVNSIYEWKYENRSGVWVPSFFKHQSRKHFIATNGKREVTDAEQSAVVRTEEWRDNQVNIEIPDTQFTLPAIGVSNGDRIHDQAADVTYRYTAISNDEPARISLRTYFIIANAGIVLALTGLWIWNRNARTTR